MAGNRKPIDWTGIEADYRKTDTSIRKLAEWYRVDERGIRDRAKRYGWTRPTKSEPAKPAASEKRDTKRVERAAAVIAEQIEAPAQSAPTSASDMLTEAYATLRDVMANSKFPAPRVTAARAVIEFARVESATKGGGGKKGERAAAAEKIAGGGSRFAPPAAPKLVVNNP